MSVLPASGGATRAVPLGEVAAIAGLVLLAFVLRAMRPQAMAVEHFDEGVYASNLFCGHLEPPFAYPMRHLYAPPLFPALLESAHSLTGRADAVMWVNILFGGFTVAALWWGTRCWFGSAAAIAAAILAATSEFHIAFSRMALTDVPLTLFLLLGVYAGWHALLTGRPISIASAGTLAGLAWCTKYNGWLALAVTGAGTAAWLATGSRRASRAVTTIGSSPPPETPQKATAEWNAPSALIRWGISAAIAAGIFWLFAVRDLEPFGGYAAVSQNHARYFVGIEGWWTGLQKHAAAHNLLSGWVTCGGIGLSMLASFWSARSLLSLPDSGRTPIPASRWLIAAALAIAATMLARLVTPTALLALLALCGTACLLCRSFRRSLASEPHEPIAFSDLAVWMLAAWLVGLLVATPLYYPYPRLSVPWLAACWPLAGAALAALPGLLIPRATPHVPTDDAPAPTPARSPTSRGPVPPDAAAASTRTAHTLLAAAVAAALLTTLVPLTGRGGTDSEGLHWPRAWQQRTGLAHVASQILTEIETHSVGNRTPPNAPIDAVLYVHGDPALFFHLSNQAPSINTSVIVLPVADPHVTAVAADDVRTFLATAADLADVASLPAPLILKRNYEWHPSDLVLLDRLPPLALRDRNQLPPDKVRLYEIRR